MGLVPALAPRELGDVFVHSFELSGQLVAVCLKLLETFFLGHEQANQSVVRRTTASVLGVPAARVVPV